MGGEGMSDVGPIDDVAVVGAGAWGTALALVVNNSR